MEGSVGPSTQKDLTSASLANVRPFLPCSSPTSNSLSAHLGCRPNSLEVLGDQSHRTLKFCDSCEEFFENANVQGRGGFGFGMELGAQRKPIGHFAFDRFDDAIRATGGHFEAGKYTLYRNKLGAPGNKVLPF